MRQKLSKKIRSRSGETLAEVLVALLIIVLAVALMIVMINTAASIDINARERDKGFYENLTAAETYTGPSTGGNVIIKIDGEAADHTVVVDVYGSGRLNAYKKQS